MLKKKYRFNPESLSYDRIDTTFKFRLLRTLSSIAALVVVAVIFNISFSYFFDTPKEKALKRENNFMKTQYDIINNQLILVENTLFDLQRRDSNIYRIIFEAEPIPYSVRMAGYGGTNKYKDLEGYSNSELVIQATRKLDQISRGLIVQSKSYDEIIDLATNKEIMLASIPAIMPISNKDLKRTASGWGYRIHPIYKIRKFHYGMDFTAPTGTDVYATGNGIILEIKRSRRGYGNHIIVDHGFGYKTLYAHLNDFNVRVGQKVKRGDIIGFVGNTGGSTAPHLHYEVHKNDVKINPINYYFNDLSPGEYEKMIIISSNSGQSFD
ncbi:MAG: M23 family metallopeptidase [Bacteroidales bacterium]|nr:M23 family metallopeptidase [Bacteroidales bacterium]